MTVTKTIHLKTSSDHSFDSALTSYILLFSKTNKLGKTLFLNYTVLLPCLGISSMGFIDISNADFPNATFSTKISIQALIIPIYDAEQKLYISRMITLSNV
jgi:hypothetical protein